MSDYVAPTLAVALPLVGGFAGGFVTKRNMTWYEGLQLPSWKPPKKAFGPVWAALNCTMGYSSYLVWRDGGGFGGDAAVPLAFYGTQLALNWAWTPIFFGLRSPKWAFFETVCMWGAIAGTIYQFSSVNESAAHLMLPYLGWVTFASVLNFRVWRDNAVEEKKE